MATIHIDYFGMPGSGPTVKEAKLDAGRKIEEALDGNYAPVLLNFRGTLLVISRDPRDWGYRMFESDELKLRTVACHCSGGFQSEGDALLAAVKHLANNKRQCGERDSELFDVLRGREQVDARRDFARDAERDDIFQARFREARGRGMDESDSHAYASMNPARRDVWESVEAAA